MTRILLAMLLALTPVAATPQGFSPDNQLCARWHEVASQLEERYGEFVMVSGVTSDGYLMEIFVNPETGTWSQVFTERTTTLSCLAAEGTLGLDIDTAAGMF